MLKLRVLSGREVIVIFLRLGFLEVSQKGSHVKLRRTVDGVRQTLTIPDHKEIARFTLHEIYRQALPYISEKELRKEFFIEI